tara:strand:+ start:1134 stop:1487 length:354 start_codon:yes stop_codon:yes gene_type:complete
VSDSHNEVDLQWLRVDNIKHHQTNAVNRNVISAGSLRSMTETGYVEYRKARVDKLRELYSKHEPKTKAQWVLPKGETDGRKSLKVEKIIGIAISPFDLDGLEDLMPKWEDYIHEYKE